MIDSLSAAPWLQARLGHEAGGRVLDLGSGGGFPGMPLAAVLSWLEVILVDSIGKKARFLEAAVAATGLAPRVTVIAERGESLAARVRDGELAPVDVVTARAVARLDRLIEVAFPLLRSTGALLAWKRGDLATELGAAEAVIRRRGGAMNVQEVQVPGLAGHRLVIVERSGQARSRW